MPARPKLTTAGRLLALVTTDDELDLARFARRLKVPERHLRECREGMRSLEPEIQLLLAALVVEVAPAHAAHARRLHAQAQSALRVREGLVKSHVVAPLPLWR